MDTIDLDHKRKISDQILLLLLVTHFQRLTKKTMRHSYHVHIIHGNFDLLREFTPK